MTDSRHPIATATANRHCLQRLVGRHVVATLYNGDCLDVLPEIEAVDAIITDPPYGTTACEWDEVIPFKPMWEHLERIARPSAAIVLFASQPFTSKLVMSNLPLFKYEWCWEKSRATDFLNAKNKPMKAHENVVVFSRGTTANCSPNRMAFYPQMREGKYYRKIERQEKRQGIVAAGNRTPFENGRVNENHERYPVSVVRFQNPNNGSIHPTQKPVPLMAYLVETYTKAGDTVLDFTMGSGTTGVACAMLGRNFIGIERDAAHYKTACDRIAHELDGALL